MSKRFGRNQRRKMREQIAALHTAYDMQEALLRSIAYDKRRLEATVRRVEARLGLFHVDLPIKSLRLSGAPGPTVRVQSHLPSAPVSPDAFLPIFEVIRHVEALLVREDVLWDELRAMVHVHVSWGEGHSAVAISEAAMYQVDPAVLAENIARDLARHLVRVIRSGRTGR